MRAPQPRSRRVRVEVVHAESAQGLDLRHVQGADRERQGWMGRVADSDSCFAVFQAGATGEAPQHFLNFVPLPQGHGSLRPTDRALVAGKGGVTSRSMSVVFSG